MEDCMTQVIVFDNQGIVGISEAGKFQLVVDSYPLQTVDMRTEASLRHIRTSRCFMIISYSDNAVEEFAPRMESGYYTSCFVVRDGNAFLTVADQIDQSDRIIAVFGDVDQSCPLYTYYVSGLVD